MVPIITCICGVLLGISFSVWLSELRNKPLGYLRVDKSNPDDGPYLFLELATDPRVIETKKQVTFKVKVENFLTQN